MALLVVVSFLTHGPRGQRQNLWQFLVYLYGLVVLQTCVTFYVTAH